MAHRKAKNHEYRRPAIGKFLAVKPRIGLRKSTWVLAAPREGTGDIRTQVVQHNDESHAWKFRPLRNGLPEPAPYTYRSPGWQERARRNGLDLAAIAAADRKLSNP